MISKKDVSSIGMGMLIGFAYASGLVALPLVFSDNVESASRHIEFTYDIHIGARNQKVIRLIAKKEGQMHRIDAGYLKNPTFNTPEEALAAGMAIAPDAIYLPQYNNFVTKLDQLAVATSLPYSR